MFGFAETFFISVLEIATCKIFYNVAGVPWSRAEFFFDGRSTKANFFRISHVTMDLWPSNGFSP